MDSLGVTVSGNYADYGGGGIYNFLSSPTLINVTLSGNSAGNDGGGMYNGSSLPYYGPSSPTLTNVTFSGNSTTYGSGGGICNYDQSSPTLTNVKLIGNTAHADGGGIANEFYSSPTLINVTFSHNVAGYNCGGINSIYQSSPTLTNVTVSGNSAGYNGGGIFSDQSSPTLTNSILWGNTANVAGSQIYDYYESATTANYSIVEGGWPGEGNLPGSADPLFVDAPTSDLHLRPGSPAIDTGTNNGVLAFDLDGRPRPFDGDEYGTATTDMGAYEFTVDLWDYGDAPDPLLGTAGKYPTLFVNNGPRHLVGSLFLGASIDAERDGQPNATATGDDTADSDDEDGVALPTTLVARVGGQATVTASAPGKLDAWIDFNRNGIFESGEQIAASLPVAAGANAVMFAVPDSIVAGTSYARFRLSTAGGLLPTGEASDGEVEDYAISLVKPATGSVQVIADPENPGRSLLLINGTSISNSIVARITAPGTVTVYIAPEVVIGSFPLNSFDRIIVFGLAGNDSIAIEAPINKPTTLYGDEGNDTIVGGQGADIIIGGDGIDSMVGNGGDDVFYGGAGNDSISGGAGFDRFIEMAGSATVTATSSKVGTSSDTFTQIEQIELTGTAASDIFVLNSVNLIVLLDAGADADTLAYTGDGKSCSRIRS